ncbi:universal stress protein [Georgenia sp. SYP-B2076]|uniref:universal stress protein n=1 Tax=Georgenia sp. SYP-B2076 TaxID=2495881 RepID=UPI000F8EAF62|nr:universal stress protein [Georgenia sp. SYP-B2076]
MTIVVGYVPTPEGHAALRRGAQWGRASGLPLVVVSSQYGDHRLDGAQSARFDAELAAARGVVSDAGVDVQVRLLVRGNDPAEDILAVAAEVDAELIVIGLRRRTPVGKLVLGSNSQRVLLGADCPVVAVKADATS